MSAEIAGRLQAMATKIEAVKSQSLSMINKVERLNQSLKDLLDKSEGDVIDRDFSKKLKHIAREIEDVTQYTKGYING